MFSLRFATPVLTALVLLSQLTACQPQDDTTRQLNALATQYLAQSGVSGVVISIGRENQITWSGGFGYADLEQNVGIVPARSLFRVGSLAKPMTAAAVGQLVETGKLDLDAPIQTYLPDFPDKGHPISTRLVAGHLAGIRHYQDDEFFSTRHYDTVSEGLTIFMDDPLVSVPGTEFHYSTYGYNLISAIVEQASGQEFLAYMDEHVFGPASMAATQADLVEPLISNRGRYYRLQDGQLLNTRWVDNSNKWAGGGFLSTADDLVRFGQAHLDSRLMQAESVNMLWSSMATTAGEQTGYGMGWRIDTDGQGRQVVGHGGGSVGGTTKLRIYPEQDLVIAVISNTSGAELDPLVDGIVEVFLGTGDVKSQ